MFKLNYRITDTIYEIKNLLNDDIHIEGFFEMRFTKNSYGYYHSNLLKDGERGIESITSWLERLLRASLVLLNSEYVAISDVESYNIWIEFQKNGDIVLVSVIEAEKEIGSSDLTISKFGEVIYSWSNEKISFCEMVTELVNKTDNFINEVCCMNAYLKKNNNIIKLNELKNKLKEVQNYL